MGRRLGLLPPTYQGKRLGKVIRSRTSGWCLGGVRAGGIVDWARGWGDGANVRDAGVLGAR